MSTTKRYAPAPEPHYFGAVIERLSAPQQPRCEVWGAEGDEDCTGSGIEVCALPKRWPWGLSGLSYQGTTCEAAP